MYILCSSYPEVENTLYLAERNTDVKIIVAGNHDLYLFLCEMNRAHFGGKHTVEFVEDHAAFHKGIVWLLNTLAEMVELDAIEGKFPQEGDYCFFGRLMNPITLHFLDGKKNIYYMPYTSIGPKLEEYRPKGIKEKLYLFIMRFVYSWNLRLGQLPHRRGFPFIPDEFMRRVKVIKRPEIKLDYSYPVKQNVIYFDQPLSHCVPDMKVYREEIDKIFEVITACCLDLAFKYHPGYAHEIDPVGEELPQSIPAEFFYREGLTCIGAFSLAIANYPGKSISIANLITIKDKERMIAVLKSRARGEISFPSTLEELKEELS